MTLSVVIPARDEAATIGNVVARVRAAVPDAEVIVIDDGSIDDTGSLARAAGATVVRHPAPRGNGASIKSGARRAQGEVIVFLDGDGQHDPADIPRLLERIDEGYDLVVAARGAGSQANAWRGAANRLYNVLASWIVGARVLDLTSGFRAARAAPFRDFIDLYPNGFSCPTTSTMVFFRAGYNVAYVPVRAAPRSGSSHIRLLRDGSRFLIIIFRIGTLYSPLKLFGPLAAFLGLSGVSYYAYTYLAHGRFTNFSTLLMMSAVFVFLMGLLSEQITALVFLHRKRD